MSASALPSTASVARHATLILPLLEDANSIQMALQQVMRLVLHHDVDYKTAGLLLYALQTASSNLRQTKFEALRTM